MTLTLSPGVGAMATPSFGQAAIFSRQSLQPAAVCSMRKSAVIWPLASMIMMCRGGLWPSRNRRSERVVRVDACAWRLGVGAATGRHRRSSSRNEVETGAAKYSELREPLIYQTFGWKPADGPVLYAESSGDERNRTVPRPSRCRHRREPAGTSYSPPAKSRRQSYSQSAVEGGQRRPLPPIDE